MVAQAQDTFTPARPALGGTPPVRALTPQERGRLGGQATFARYGRDHYAAIGRVGFARAIEAGWGAYLLEKHAPPRFPGSPDDLIPLANSPKG